MRRISTMIDSRVGTHHAVELQSEGPQAIMMMIHYIEVEGYRPHYLRILRSFCTSVGRLIRYYHIMLK